MRFKLFVLGAATLAVAVANPEIAFGQRSVRFGIAPSAAFATGSFSELVGGGPGFLFAVTAGSNTSVLGFRFDVSDHLLKGRRVEGVKQGDVHVTAVTANAVISLPVFRYIKPYALGGVGVHPFNENRKRTYDFGVNAGAGITFPFVVGSGFLEARYHRIYGREMSQRYIPVSLGLMF